jgi:5-methylcytosine-specific restriction endonuclease McrA
MTSLKNLERNINSYIPDYVDFYYDKKDFYREDEGYKFKAVNTFRVNFDLEADDVPEMLRSSFADSKNLIQSGNYFPQQMLIEISEDDPEFVREELKKLLSEDAPVADRINDFIASFESKHGTEDKSLFFDARFLSFILASVKPENNFYIKWSEYTQFADMVGYELDVNLHSSQGDKYDSLSSLAVATRLILKRNDDFMQMHEDYVSEFEYKDPFISWGTWDFIFNMVRQSTKTERQIEIENELSEMDQEREESIAADVEHYSELEQINKQELLEKAKSYRSKRHVESGNEKTIEVKLRQENRKQMKIVKKLEDYRCQVCGYTFTYINSKDQETPYVEVDHIKRYADEGDEDLDNLWALCPTCHTKKTLGVIVVDKKEGEVRENGEVIEIKNNHLSWYELN